MSKFTYIRPTNDNLSEYIALAIPLNSIETIPLADCTNEYGIKVGHVDAGDYLYIHKPEAIGYLAEKYEIEYNGTDVIDADHELFDFIISEVDQSAYTFEQEMVQAYQYYDGHNWHTEIFGTDTSYYEVVEDEKLIELYNELWESREEIYDQYSYRKFSTCDENIFIIKSQHAGDFESFKIINE